jgi:hypothetical protein
MMEPTLEPRRLPSINAGEGAIMGLPRLSLLSEDDEIPILRINLHKMS